MPFDRVADDWPPPSPEAVIRERVLGRARSLMLRRLAPVALSLMVATGVVVADRLPDGESSSRIDMLDEGGSGGDGGGGTEAEADSTETESASASSPGTSGPADAPAEAAKRVAGGPRAKAAAGAEATPDDSPTEPRAYDADVTSMTDESGDGRHEPSVCVGNQCAEGNPYQANQPALDLLELRLADDGSNIRVTTKVLDVDQEPDSSVQVDGVPASHVAYLSDLSLPDGVVRVVTVRAIADGAVTAYAYYYADQDGSGPGTRIAGVTGSVDVAANEAQTVVPMAGINAVRGSHPAVGAGTVFTPRMGVAHASTRSVGDDPGASYIYDAFETTVAAEYEV